MTVELIHKVDDKPIKEIFKNVCEVQDNSDNIITIKFHNHLCHRYKVDEMEELKIYRDTK